jgi:hypothetical protein
MIHEKNTLRDPSMGEEITNDHSALLASKFRQIGQQTENKETHPFLDLERDLLSAGFALGAQPEVARVLNDPSLLCRSESFSKTMNLILDSAPLIITNRDHANMCIMASGGGFRVAMQEGFSGDDVGNVVKTVLSFSGEHLVTRKSIRRDDSLWETKPDTASVSLSGGGEVLPEDIRMISFRFPINYFPKEVLSETERDALEEGRGGFIVRHYMPIK